MTRLRLCFDFDNTMVGLTEGLIMLHNRRCACRLLSMADFTTYDAAPCPVWKQRVEEFYASDGHYIACVQPYPHAFEVVERLARVHDVRIISRYMKRDRDTTERKRAVLHQHCAPIMHLLTGVYAGNQRGKDGRHLKRPVAPLAEGAHVIVDDAPLSIQASRLANVGATIIAAAQPYNLVTEAAAHARVHVALGGWLTIEAIIMCIDRPARRP